MAGLLLLGYLLSAASAAPDAAFRQEVPRLVRQLDSPQFAQREEAEKKLLEFGPRVLDLLPETGPQTPAEVRQRLARVRQQLQRTLAETAAEAALVTFQSAQSPAGQVLAAIGRQTGNKIIDDRSASSDEPIAVRFDKTPFWRALDEVLDKTGLDVYPYGEDRAVQIVPRMDRRDPRTARACYRGPFRFEPVQVVSLRDLRQPDQGSCKLWLEVAWEPRLRPISLRQRMSEVRAADEHGRPLPADQAEAELEVPVRQGQIAAQLLLPLALPPRQVKQIAKVQGTLRAVLPGRTETFRFDRIGTAGRAQQRIAGTTVVLEEVRKSQDSCEVRIVVRFDEAADALQSHRSWFFQNEAYLEGPDGRKIRDFSTETTRHTDKEIGLALLFDLAGPADAYALVYKTPVLILTTAFPYEVTTIDLP